MYKLLKQELLRASNQCFGQRFEGLPFSEELIEINDSPRDVSSVYSSPIAFQLTKLLKGAESPYRIAESIQAEVNAEYFEVSLSGEGFINFRLKEVGLSLVLERLGSGDLHIEPVDLNLSKNRDCLKSLESSECRLESFEHLLQSLLLIEDVETESLFFEQGICCRENLPAYLTLASQKCEEILEIVKEPRVSPEAEARFEATWIQNLNGYLDKKAGLGGLESFQSSALAAIIFSLVRWDNSFSVASLSKRAKHLQGLAESFFNWWNHPESRELLVVALEEAETRRALASLSKSIAGTIQASLSDLEGVFQVLES